MKKPSVKFLGNVDVKLGNFYSLEWLADSNNRVLITNGILVEIKGTEKGQRTFLLKGKYATLPVLERTITKAAGLTKLQIKKNDTNNRATGKRKNKSS